MQYTFKSEVVYEANNDETGVLAQVMTSSNIRFKFKVVVHDVDAGEVVGTKSFVHRDDAEAYADCCTFG